MSQSAPVTVHVTELVATSTFCGVPFPLPSGHRTAIFGAPILGRVTCDACRDRAAEMYRNAGC